MEGGVSSPTFLPPLTRVLSKKERERREACVCVYSSSRRLHPYVHTWKRENRRNASFVSPRLSRERGEKGRARPLFFCPSLWRIVGFPGKKVGSSLLLRTRTRGMLLPRYQKDVPLLS